MITALQLKRRNIQFLNNVDFVWSYQNCMVCISDPNFTSNSSLNTNHYQSSLSLISKLELKFPSKK